MSMTRQRRYKPYVPDFLSLCERNYAQLRHLLPRSDQVGDAVQIQVSAADKYLLKLQELCKFTSTIRIEHISEPLGADQVVNWLRPQFDVRLYTMQDWQKWWLASMSGNLRRFMTIPIPICCCLMKNVKSTCYCATG